VYTQPGIYTVTLTTVDGNGCTDSLVKPFYIVITKPIADFNTKDTSSCPSKLVQFTNLSLGNSLMYSWDFGDNTTSDDINPAHAYAATGTYTITLKITDQYGCIDSVSKQNYIRISLPEANFSLSDSVSDCPPFVVTFTDLSVNYTNLSWEFGDGNTSTEKTPQHTYNLPGIYKVKLTATGPGGCFDEIFATIIVNGPTGVLKYNQITGCNTLQTNFNATSKNNIIFTWDFNDGVTITTKDSILSHVYTNPGFYVPKLILEDDKGCKVPITGTDTIKVYEVKPGFTASPTTVCDAGSVAFIDSTTSNDIISGYSWDFGDGTTSTEQNPLHVYTAPGSYNVRMIVNTQSGCLDTADYPAYIRVIASPGINILASAEACEFADVIFKGNLLQPDTSSLTWEWDFGNGQISSQQNPTQQYTTSGAYTVNVIATNSIGCKDTASHSIFINPLPQTNAGNDAFLCLGTPLQLQASGANTYQWLVPSDNLSCTSCAAPVTTTPDNITYVVKGISLAGCEKSDSVNIRVYKPFTVAVNPLADSICTGQQIQLNAFGAENYIWSPDATLSGSTISNPFASPDVNTVYKIIGFDSANCFKDSAFIPVSVFPYPTVELGIDQTIKVGSSIALSSQYSNDVIKWLWTPATGLSCTTCPAPVAKPDATTTYTLQVENNGGCSVTDNVTIIVICNNENVFIPNTFSPNGDGANDVFYVRGSGLFTIKNLRILNRWGEVVFEKTNANPNDISQGWNGTYKGKMLLPDVFVYVVDVVCNNNSTLTYSGNVTLIR
ncbi:MAG: PKD domain-containing protein, partial [Chitinophagaceae bacterium]|nr:PKD domain-containing protein [Chitinophagaceae bacterium]